MPSERLSRLRALLTGTLVLGLGLLAWLAIDRSWPARNAILGANCAVLTVLWLARVSVEHRQVRGGRGLLPWDGWLVLSLTCAVLLGFAGALSARATALAFIALVVAALVTSLRHAPGRCVGSGAGGR